jgi:hypothetical protein
MNVALDASKMLDEGTSLAQVRAEIEHRYGGLGPSTDTPPPPPTP